MERYYLDPVDYAGINYKPGDDEPFTLHVENDIFDSDHILCACPNTDEIIEALGEDFIGLAFDLPEQRYFVLGSRGTTMKITELAGKTPLEAVCELFIALSEHKKEKE